MVRTARASVMAGKEFEIREYPVPEPEPGKVLVKQELGGICGTDLHNWQFQRLGYDVILGHENVGTLDALGDGVSEDALGNPVQVGDRVVVSPHLGVGFQPIDRAPGLRAGFGQYIYLWNPTNVFLKTDLPPEIAVLTEPSACSYHCVSRAGIQLGDTGGDPGHRTDRAAGDRLGPARRRRPADRGRRTRRTPGVRRAARRRPGDQHRRGAGRRGTDTDRARQHAARRRRRRGVRVRRFPVGDPEGSTTCGVAAPTSSSATSWTPAASSATPTRC